MNLSFSKHKHFPSFDDTKWANETTAGTRTVREQKNKNGTREDTLTFEGTEKKSLFHLILDFFKNYSNAGLLNR